MFTSVWIGILCDWQTWTNPPENPLFWPKKPHDAIQNLTSYKAMHKHLVRTICENNHVHFESEYRNLIPAISLSTKLKFSLDELSSISHNATRTKNSFREAKFIRPVSDMSLNDIHPSRKYTMLLAQRSDERKHEKTLVAIWGKINTQHEWRMVRIGEWPR